MYLRTCNFITRARWCRPTPLSARKACLCKIAADQIITGDTNIRYTGVEVVDCLVRSVYCEWHI